MLNKNKNMMYYNLYHFNKLFQNINLFLFV